MVDTSNAVTVKVKGAVTELTVTFMECALASVQGVVPDRQNSVALCETFVPGLKVKGTVMVCGGGATPVPDKLIDCIVPGTLPALSVIMIDAVLVPTASGAKETWKVQCAPAASVDGKIGQSLVCRNSVGFALDFVIPVMASGTLPVFVKVSDCVALVVPICWLENVKFGDTLTAGVPLVMVNVAVACWTPVATVMVFGPAFAFGSICS